MLRRRIPIFATAHRRKILAENIVASPSGRAFGCAGTTPMARFHHTASIADARCGGGHFGNGPQRRGFRGAGPNRQRIDANKSRAAALEPCPVTKKGRKARSAHSSWDHPGGGVRGNSAASSVDRRAMVREQDRVSISLAQARSMAVAARIRLPAPSTLLSRAVSALERRCARGRHQCRIPPIS